MKRELRAAYRAELRAARLATGQGRVEAAFHHLERAHVLAQRHTLEHVHVHWLMLRLGVMTGAWREILGQPGRIIAAAMFSRIWVPAGNTGRANVSPFKRMTVPEDLQAAMGERDGRDAPWR